MASLRRARVIFAFSALTGGVSYADEVPLSTTLNPEQAQARQFGIFFGGAASTFDLCVRKGFIAKSNQNAEETARTVLAQMSASNKGPDVSAYVQDGWETMKKEIAGNEAFYTKEKCVFVEKEWDKIMTALKKS